MLRSVAAGGAAAACAALLAGAAGAAATAPPAQVAVVVESATWMRDNAALLARTGAVGLVSPGAGATVTRAAALASLVRGVSHSASRGALPSGKVLIALARQAAPGPRGITIHLALPPEGRTPNRTRYPIAIVGGGYRGLLRSPSTRIPGLVSIADIAPAAVALAAGRTPGITWQAAPAAGALPALAATDRRLDESKDAAYAASLAIVGAALFLAGLAWLVRSPVLARAALLVAPATIVTSFSLTLAGIGDSPSLRLGLSLAAPLGGLLAGFLTGGRRRFAAAFLATLLFVLVVLAAEPWAAGLTSLGPEPGSGGRFYGIGNGMETLLLPAVLLPGALLGLRWLPATALLALAAIGLSRTGADGGGVIVILAATLVLALRLRGRRPSLPVLLGAGVATVVLAAMFVGLDALAGGHSHVTAAAGGGPFTVVTDIATRLRVSAHKVVAGPGVIIASVWSVIGLAWVGTRRRRSPVIDAFLVAVAVSLLVNDTPVLVLAFAVLQSAPLLAWETVRRARRTAA